MNQKIKVGIVGMGRIARDQHIPEMASYPDRFEIVAVADNAPDRLKNLPEAIKGVETYSSLDAMLKKSKAELLVIGTRHPEHVPMAIQVLNAGKAVLLEKPISTTVKEMIELKKVADRHPGKLFLRHNRRYEAAFQKALELVNSGAIGEMQYAKLYRSVGYCRRNDWMTMRQFQGGLLTNWGPHLIDQGLCFLASPVADLWADVRRVISIGDGDDLFKILLKGKNGRVVDIEVSGCNTMPGREMEIIGSRGTLVFPVDGKILVRAVDPAIKFKKLKPHPENAPLRYGNFEETLTFVESKYDLPPIPFSELWKYVYDSMVNGAPFPIAFDQALEVVKITEQAFRKSGFPN